MKTFGKFLRESSQMMPGAVVMLINGQAFSKRTLYGVSTGRVIFKVENLRQHGAEFQGTTKHHELLDPYGWQLEVLLQGLQPGDTIQSYLQLDGLPSGAIIETSTKHTHGLPEDQYKKIDQTKWVKMGDGGIKKYDSFHFDPALKYIWKS